jgi:hypothetical protein
MVITYKTRWCTRKQSVHRAAGDGQSETTTGTDRFSYASHRNKNPFLICFTPIYYDIVMKIPETRINCNERDWLCGNLI